MTAGAGPRPIVVVHVLGGQERGGIVTHLLSLAEHLDPQRFGQQAVLLRPGLEGQLAAAGIAPHLIRKRRRGDPTVVLRLVQHLRRTRPDVVHTHSVTSNLYGRVAARLAGAPAVITTAHGFVADILRQNPGVPRPMAAPLAWLDLAMSRFSDRLVAVSESIASDVAKRGARPARVVAIPNGVDATRFEVRPEARSAAREGLGVPPGAPLVGTVGSLVPLRNHALLLSAAGRVLAGAPEARFVLVGEGSEGPRLRAMAEELGLAERVVFTGARDDIPELLSAFDVFALSCDTEGFGLAALEAMAAGRPIVATRVGALPELIEEGESGLLVPARDAASLADALLRVLRDPGLARRLGDAAHARAASEYSAARQAARMAALYLDVLGPRVPREASAATRGPRHE